MSRYGGKKDWHLAEITFQINGTSRQICESISGWRIYNLLDLLGVSGKVSSALSQCVGRECVLGLEYKKIGFQDRVVEIYSMESFGGVG